MAGQNILEGVAILHETIQELHRKNLNVVIFKIDFEKVYDKDRWPFPFQMFLMKAFEYKGSPQWEHRLPASNRTWGVNFLCHFPY